MYLYFMNIFEESLNFNTVCVWVKHSTTTTWTQLTPAAATHMDAGNMRGGMNPWQSAAIEGFIELSAPLGGPAKESGSNGYNNRSDKLE